MVYVRFPNSVLSLPGRTESSLLVYDGGNTLRGLALDLTAKGVEESKGRVLESALLIVDVKCNSLDSLCV